MNTPHDTGKSPERLNKFLARQLGISRREADVLIENETVMVNHTLATLGTRITPSDSIDVAGAPVSHKPAALHYIAFNKPVGYVCSRRTWNPPNLKIPKSAARKAMRRQFTRCCHLNFTHLNPSGALIKIVLDYYFSPTTATSRTV